MYLELFALDEMPFRLTPDPHFLFASKQHARAKAYMESTVWLADGFVVITGEIGSGKTTLIESFLEELPEDVILAQINQTQLSPVEFLQALLVEFGYKPFRKKKVELLAMLKEHMIEQYALGKTLLLIIDEAQNLSRKVLEEVRMISGIESQKEKLLRIILAGQPELSQKLDSPRLAQLSQRVRLRFHLGALSRRETHEYINHRLEVAGSKGRKIFADDAYDLVFRYAGGIPRLTNILCDTAMLCAFAADKNEITADVLRTAVDELQWVPYANRPSNAAPSDDTGRFHHDGSHVAHFEVLFHDQVITDFPVSSGRAIIGRTGDNDLQIRSKFVSRHHAQIVSTPESCVVEDLNSTNGVFIDGQRIKRHQLGEGDVLQLGEHRLVYHDLRAGVTQNQAGNVAFADEDADDEGEDADEDADVDDADDEDDRDDEEVEGDER